MKTTVANLNKNEPYDIFIGRPSRWGNPIKLAGGLTREVVIRLYINYLANNGALLSDIRKELKGKILGCYCAPKLCHGDVLAHIANLPDFEASILLVDYTPAELSKYLESTFLGSNLNGFESL